ncbi:Gamma-aminobutyrate:alpha-ketoglutarate aminotransferase [Klebsiella grimontii]|uniref:Gamma-aminobutyrate:alpha-ketoglutarate aminotransferase n=1 Tax=Klebsiella grimontii TaxID=2058152 RepID=A0A7H4NV74_9ENTR|nr:Gamma-aminobutyrate:alpha-ketoglutarate aminotransferase [Klebsiella grimontii]
MKSSELNQRRQQATPRGVGVMCSYFVEKAENATLWDIEGNEVIDFRRRHRGAEYRPSAP